MVNLFLGFMFTVMGCVLIIQYGNTRAVSRRKKYFDINVTIACTDLLLAGIQFAKFIYR